MDTGKFGKNKTRELIKIIGIEGLDYAFIPDPLPPKIDFPNNLWPLLLEAGRALAKLDGIGAHLPNSQLLLSPLQNREAIRSSSLEGTFATPEQLLLFQINPEHPVSEMDPRNAYQEVNNYKKALQYHNNAQEKLPFSLRLIRNLHKILLEGVRGENKTPGEFRRVQNQIGRPARYVPPPPNYLDICLDKFEKYLHEPSLYDCLVNAFLVHYQFEAIHPFLDGNGRVGRLILAILIKDWCKLSDQWLYMSAYFDSNKDEYIDRLFNISAEGDWEGWIKFCLIGVVQQATDAISRCEKLIDLTHTFKIRLTRIKGDKRLSSITEDLFVAPFVQVPYIKEKYGITYPTAKSDILKLVDAKILTEFSDVDQKTYYSPEILEIAYR